MRGLRQSTSSRRQLLAGSGVVLGAGLLGTNTVLGQEQEEEEPAEIPAQFDQPNTDVDILNYALTLERLEDTFYQEGLDTFSGEELAQASAIGSGGDLGDEVGAYFQTVSEHESTHTEQLLRVIETLGAEPAPEPEFQFGFETAEDFLATAQVLENTGVGAYAGAAPRIESPDILSAALSIHSVEARHAATLNLLNGESPFPDAFDPALSIPDVLTAIEPFIASGMPEEMEEEEETETETEEEETETETEEEQTETATEEETDTEVPGETDTLEETEVPEETETEIPEGTDTPDGT
jgi:hypothetical protein